MSILIADDEPHVRRLLRLTLRPLGEIVEAADGEEALHALEAHRPAIAVLDVMMPHLSGLEVCRQLRADPETDGTGVIVITANGSPEDRAVALDAGADHFVPKPFSPLVMERLVRALLAARTPVQARAADSQIISVASPNEKKRYRSRIASA
jgi:DNA-binding response OmpR family regulator